MRKILCILLFTGTLTNVFSQQIAGWKADLALIQRELPKRHPDLYRYYSKQNFEADLADLASKLEGRTQLQIALELQTILSKIGDANTRLDLAPLLQQSKIIPVGMGWYEDGLYVSGTVKRFAAALGKRVLEINGLKTEEALQRMGRFFALENEEVIRRDGPQWLRFPEAMRMAGVAESDTLTLLLIDEQGKRSAIKTYPIDFKTDKSGLQPAQFVPESPDFRWDPVKNIYTLLWLGEQQIAYLQYNACFSQEMQLAAGDSLGSTQLPPFQPLADSVAAWLDRSPQTRFFFDLRFNSSGNPADGIALAERLASMPLVNLPNRLFVAVNRYTSGPAVEIAATFQAKTNATLMGEPPAQRPNHFGDPQAIILPNSKIQLSYGSREVSILPGDPAALNLQIPVELPFADFREGRDPVLDYVRQH